MQNEIIPDCPDKPNQPRPSLARLLRLAVMSLIIAAMQFNAYAVCANCWEREVANTHLSDATSYADAVRTELQSAQDALDSELNSASLDYDTVESLNLQITELNSSLATAEQQIANWTQALQNTPPCMQDPPCGQGVPQDPVLPEDPPYDPQGPGLPEDPMPVDNPPPPEDPEPV